jgi:predicted nucleic acid-binding protein
MKNPNFLTNAQWLGLEDLSGKPTKIAKFGKEYLVEDKYTAMFYFASQNDMLLQAIACAAIYEYVSKGKAYQIYNQAKYNKQNKIFTEKCLQVFLLILENDLKQNYGEKHALLDIYKIASEYKYFKLFILKYLELFNINPIDAIDEFESSNRKKNSNQLFNDLIILTAIGNLKQVYYQKNDLRYIDKISDDVMHHDFYSFLCENINNYNIEDMPPILSKSQGDNNLDIINGTFSYNVEIKLFDMVLQKNIISAEKTKKEIDLIESAKSKSKEKFHDLLIKLQAKFKKYSLDGVFEYDESENIWEIEIKSESFYFNQIITDKTYQEIGTMLKNSITTILFSNDLEFERLASVAKYFGFDAKKPSEVLNKDIDCLKQKIEKLVEDRISFYNNQLNDLGIYRNKIYIFNNENNVKVIGYRLLNETVPVFSPVEVLEKIKKHINYIKEAIAKEQQAINSK